MINDFYDAALWRLPKNEIGPRQSQSHIHYNWIRNIATIFGVGVDIIISLIPGLDVVSPFVIGTEFAVWESIGGINYWINSRPGQGGNNWMTDILNFGIPVLGIVITPITSILKLSKESKVNKTFEFNESLEHAEQQTIEVEQLFKKIGFTDDENKELLVLLSKKNKQSLNKGLTKIYNKLIDNNKYNNEITRELINMIQTAINTNEMDNIISAVVSSFKAINKKYKIMLAKENWTSKFGIKPYMTPSQKVRRFLASHKFRHDYVDRLKYLNPSMAARKPINFAYRQLEKIFGKYFKKMFDDDSKQVIKKAFKLSKKEIKRMIRNGKTIHLNSQWLNSLRVIKPSPELNLTLITFDEKITYGKEPVFIWATVKELEELIASPGRTYINKFAISRGGKSVGVLGLFGIKGSHFANKVFNNVFQFLPIQAVRNVLSILGNFKREIPKMKNGTYFNTYLDDYRKAFISYGIGRSTRLIARGILAPALTHSGMFDKAFAKVFKTNDLGKIRREVKRFVGMELQRYGTATISYGIKNELKGQSFAHGMGNRLTYAITRTPRDQIAHYERERTHGHHTYGVKQIRYLRVAKIYRRIPNTFMTKNFKKRFY